jgi:DNA-binding NtrC family response regulator
MKDSSDFSILIVDDEINIRNSFKFTLMDAGYLDILTAESPSQALEIIKRKNVGLVLLDLIMPEIGGEELLEKINSETPEIIAIVVSGLSDLKTAVECMKRGAFDYIQKPMEKDRLVASVRNAIEMLNLRRENLLIKETFLSASNIEPEFSHIITDNEEMKAIFKYTKAISQTTQPILICGETGVGKELFPKAIHKLSGRQGKLVSLNSAGLDSNVFFDTLFGHEKGAYTGAVKARKGLIEKAENGSIFLDEIGDLDLASQVKLLRLLQEKEYIPLGSDTVKHSNSRAITATNKNLKEMVSQGKFREDLYYRLQTHQIKIPPLRKRLNDIKSLLDHFLEKAFSEMKKKTPSYPSELISLLKNYNYPGNVRELRAMVYDAAAKHESKLLSMRSFEEYIGISQKAEQSALKEKKEEGNGIIYPETLPSLENANKSIIKEALKRSDGNQSLAAKLLGISQQTLNYRVKKM